MNKFKGKKRKLIESKIDINLMSEESDQKSDEGIDNQSIDSESIAEEEYMSDDNEDINSNENDINEDIEDNGIEDTEDNGVEEDYNSSEELMDKKSKLNNTNGKKKSKTKTPSAQELNNLRETEALFHSSLFRLQLDEMLSEVKLKEKWSLKINQWIKKFETLLSSIKSLESRELTDQLWLTVKVPIIQEPFDVKGIFTFEAPKLIKVFGSYGLGTAFCSQTVIDIAIEIPKNCWQRQDNLNQRYHRKRALYLSYISQMVKSNEIISEMKFSYFNGNHTKPILLVKPNGKIAKYCTFAIYAYPESDQKVFRSVRFSPEKNNVRSDWLLLNECEELPTPVYNSSIQNDLNLISNYEHLSKTVKDSPNIKDSLILLKVWLKQREMRSSFGFIISMFVCYLLENRKISRYSSCYQIFRNTLLSIMNSKWDSEGITMNNSLSQPLDDYLTYFPVVFIDPTGYHNLCWDLTIDSYERLKHESKLTIDSLDSNQPNSFELAFMKPIEFEFKFDALLKISVNSLLECSKVSEINNDIIDQSGDILTAFVTHLIPLCKRTLGQRILLIQHKSKSSIYNEWSTDHLPPHPNNAEFITFGLLINAENAYNTIERGPSADCSDAKDFKDFWGNKSELRRFQDGSICETVFWPTKTFADKRKIISQSLEFILSNILNISNESIAISISQLDPILELPNLNFENDNMVYGTGEEQALSCGYSFDTLAKILRGLEGLPLVVTSVQGIDTVFRGTDVFPPIPMNSGKSKLINNFNIFDINDEQQRVPKYFKPLEVIIQLEGSGKWPQDINALQRVKASFYIELSKKLWTQNGLINYANSEYIDVFQDGFIFRIIIACHKELILLRQLKTSEGLIKTIDNVIADDLELKTEIMPKISSALNGINKQYQCYGIACRLAKRWIASQMIGHYFDDIAIELIMASIFLNSSPFTVPNSPITGFIRFLCLISDHNWKISPLIVNLNNEMSDEMLADVNSKFTTERPNLPPMFITSPYDKQLSIWTKSSPTPPILNRLQNLAKAAKNSLFLQLNNSLTNDFKPIFRPALDIYDVIIRLKSEQITNQVQAIDFPLKYTFAIKQFKAELNERMPIIDFDPIHKYLQLLRSSYSEFALFFYDRFGGREIGVLWKPSIFESHPFKISQINGVLLSSITNKNGSQNVITNIEAIVEDFSIIGNGIVSSIETRTENWEKK